ncbi:nuclear transport factor 2 family protein [Jiulongibacter sediminis]|jgi:ketosteroid isomerase-like protein|uniref:nuclear transport factor 2 family protein n=1 Tax=Jiulongibacter sediminis TaxID=1605367 RepID=UPI0026ECAA3A|nr:nuclear transport factor 2 family protein [Jiulongibacter sediminis]
MKKPFITLSLLFAFFIAHSQENCLTKENLLKLDLQWEQALLVSDADFLSKLLADEFIWIHNHNSMTDSKEALVKRAADPNRKATGDTKSRISRDVTVAIQGSTAVVTGITVVDRGPTPTTYHFMRTYARKDGKCYLLGNHTMAVPEDEK